ncbi:hypothetical protein ABZX85_19035 [Streptomyces sp. NPDC004539]|uniref:hypothetical protein n=1 Tax=Streptomyces sp. NPDC004539 TaxID=3154280 RepID=UPI0033BB0541
MHSVSEFRQWLVVRPQLVLRMMRHVEKVHSPVFLNYPGAPAPAARRRQAGARLWISRVPEEILRLLSHCGLSVGCSQLVELGQEEFLEDPDLDQLVRMLEMLPPELAQLVLYGLTCATHLPTHRFTESHGEELRRAVALEGEPAAADIWERPSCAPAMWGSEKTEGAAVGVDADSTAEAQAPTPDVLSLRTTRLREEAAELVDRLEMVGSAIRDGRQPAGYESVLSAVTSWVRERQCLAEAFAEAVPGVADDSEPSDPWGPDAGWGEAAAVTERLREEEYERERIAEEIAEVVQARDEAVGLLEQAVSDLMRQNLVYQVEQFEQKLRELRGEPETGTTVSEAESDFAASAGTDRVPPDHGESGATDPGPATDDEIPVPEGETAPHGANDEVRGQDDTPASQNAGTEDSPGSVNTPKPVEAATTVVLPGPEAVDRPEAAPQDVGAARVRREPTSSDRGEHQDDGTRVGDNRREVTVPATFLPSAPPRTQPDAGEANPASADGWAGVEATLEALVTDGRLAEAYWVSRAARVSEYRTRALAFADAAFHDSPASASDLQVKAEEYLDAVTRGRPLEEDRDAHFMVVTAAVRSGISAHWASSALTGDHTSVPGLPDPWAKALEGLVLAVRKGAEITPGGLRVGAAAAEANRFEKIAEQARQLAVDLPQRKIRYQRATVVLQTLAGPDGVLGATLHAIEEWADKGGKSGAEKLSRLMDEHFRRIDAADRLIDDTDRVKRTTKQAKNDIHSGARLQLRAHIKSVQDLLIAALRAAEAPTASGSGAIGPELPAALEAARAAGRPPGVGGALFDLLVRWLDRSYTPGPRDEDVRFPPPADALLTLPGLPWHSEHGRYLPNVAAPEAFAVLADILRPHDPAGAFAWHRAHGDLHLAERLLNRISAGEVPGVELTAVQFTEQRQALSDAAGQWQDRCTKEHRSAQLALARVRAQNLLTHEVERQFTGRLLDLEGEVHGGSFGERLRAVEQVAEDLHRLERERGDDLRHQLGQVRLTEQDASRIRDLLDRGETVAAEELLTFARQGRPLPEAAEPAGEVLSRFLTGVGHPEAPRPDSSGGSARWWADHYASGEALVRNAVSGLDAWDLLGQSREAGKVGKAVVSVLRLLGLSASPPNVEEAKWGVTRLSVRADITESTPGYVAALGSYARRTYKVVVITDELRGEGPLRHLPASAIEANIILYTQPLGVEGRCALARESRGRSHQALVVDPAVVGWVAAHAPRSFRAVQQVTLPWTGYTPYTPHVAGLVPPEVFKGRTDEMRAVLDPQGPIFLFGGRQLGKSSLLRQAVEVFQKDDGDNRVAVYIDLMRGDIGHAEPPEGIWRMLLTELKRRGVISESVADRAPGNVIANEVQQWIEERPERRLLLLADEADAFLTADAQAVYTGGGQSTFPTVKRLQRLMEDTGRDFKVVFAGLHQVQRFNRLINVVTAHGGRDVPVGPLKPQDAVELVEEPMAAVGLTFEARDLVWHILGLTNYQANLLQIFCDRLVAYMQQRSMPADGRHAPITWEDVQQVAGMEEVRGLIAERLRYTINLEDRYRVLALLIALRSLEQGHGHGYRPAELLERAHERWPDGFPLNSERQLTIYLEEMVNLGLLIRLPGDERVYAMRSPNVVNMLGTQAELENELRDTQFDLPYDYNPSVARRSLGTDRRNQVQRMSPLTDGQLSDILTHPNRTTLVPSTSALSADLVQRGIQLHIDGHGLAVVSIGPDDDLTEFITANSRRKSGSRLLFVDLRGQDTARLQEATDRLLDHTRITQPRSDNSSSVPRRHAVVLCDPDAAAGVVSVAGLVRPERWTVDSVRAWSESPFGSPRERRSLIEVTGGWPTLVELAMHKVRSGMRQQEVFDELRAEMAVPERAKAHLELAGLNSDDVGRLAAWAQFYTEEEHRAGLAVAAAGDLQAAFHEARLYAESDAEDTLPAVERFLVRLDLLGVLDVMDKGETLDQVTFRSIKAIGGDL